MTEHTKEFLSHYPESYGHRHKYAADYSRCCARVWGGWHESQCSRKNGHGPDGAYCKQHDPVEQKKRRQRKEVEEKIRHWSSIERDRLAAAVGDAVLYGRDPQPHIDVYRKREAEIKVLALGIKK